jgi:hypothetical protein
MVCWVFNVLWPKLRQTDSQTDTHPTDKFAWNFLFLLNFDKPFGEVD